MWKMEWGNFSNAEQSAATDPLEVATEQIYKMRVRDKELSPELELQFNHTLREAVLNQLLEIERIRQQQLLLKTEDFEQLRTLLAQDALNATAKQDVETCLHLDRELQDAALTTIAFLREADHEIHRLEVSEGFEDADVRAHVRQQHLQAYETEWGIQ
ncbi:hypothetical protein GF380_01010 [Candidatus Uhrbacteria bacterium]|nr:hypothetical protein [Candidatus Uhrbacteria bacterium]MBD3283900.1 hypothetical protein [Candidatus Uhrbacteria bacterium]